MLEALIRNKFLCLFQYAIAQEDHEDKGKNFHVLIIPPNKTCMRSEKVLYLLFYGKTDHGHYHKAHSVEHFVNHVCKQGDYITNIIVPLQGTMPNIIEGRFLSKKQKIVQRAKKEGIPRALVAYALKKSKQAFPNTPILTILTS